MKRRIEKFERETFSAFKIRNCVTKNWGEKISNDKVLKEGIYFYSTKYVCKHGGKSHQQFKSTGQRES